MRNLCVETQERDTLFSRFTNVDDVTLVVCGHALPSSLRGEVLTEPPSGPFPPIPTCEQKPNPLGVRNQTSSSKSLLLLPLPHSGLTAHLPDTGVKQMVFKPPFQILQLPCLALLWVAQEDIKHKLEIGKDQQKPQREGAQMAPKPQKRLATLWYQVDDCVKPCAPQAGANMIVSGSAIMRSDDPRSVINLLRNVCSEAAQKRSLDR
ncbi:hypothetical protein PANDA_016670 [Ailuropoda melanoleuca]|uniref:Uncharacterized protein n=1 Tax=Ailuropoda melanoleuca TaxID=9646 RepID=D2HW52_AILME|nr:hypothetical protein PANDA_016670 [Ailuropoda melanoleuca]